MRVVLGQPAVREAVMTAFEMTPDQARAVTTLSGDVAIRAGAGSGKTMVLAHRFAAALQAHELDGWTPAAVDEVLTITFTKKAAGEVAERVRRVVSEQCSAETARAVDEAWISTIHTFCGRLIRRHILESGVDPGFAQLDDLESAVLSDAAFEQALEEACVNDPAVVTLVTDYGLKSIRESVVACHDNARAMGLDPERLIVDNGENELQSMVDEALRIAIAIDTVLADANPTDRVRQNRRAVNQWCESIRACRLEEEGGAERLGQVTDSWEASRITGAAALMAAHAKLRGKIGLALGFIASVESTEAFERLARSYALHYRTAKQARAALDFEDLQERAVALLRDRPDIADRLRDHFRLIMVDEFQDTNALQMAVLAPLRSENLCIVGDDKQAIYGWRFADVGIFDGLSRAAETSIQLAANFRSHPEILGFVNAVFSQDHLFGAGFMRLTPREDTQAFSAIPADEHRIEVMCIRRGSRIDEARALEAREIARRAARMVQSGQVKAGHIAVLVRASTAARIYAKALEDAGVPTTVAAGAGLFDEAEAQELTTMLRAVAVPTDDRALALVLGGRWVGMSDAGLAALRHLAGRRSLWEGLTALAQGEGSAPPADLALGRWAHEVLTSVGSRLGELTLPDTIYELIEAFDYDLTLFAEGAAGVRAWANVEKIVRLARAFATGRSHDAAEFSAHLDLLAQSAREAVAPVQEGDEATTIMTIHGSKGLEFPVVFVANLTSQQSGFGNNTYVSEASDGSSAPVVALKLPGKDAPCSAAHVRAESESRQARSEEEKRALYVALTRAEGRLVISGAANLDKPAEESGALIDWVRQAIGDPDGSGELQIEGTPVLYTVVEPPEEPSDESSETHECSTQPETVPVTEVVLPEWAPPEEREVPVDPRSVSFSALRLHEQCALSYHASRTLGLAAFSPQEPEALGFGTAVHEVMQRLAAGAVPSETIEHIASRDGPTSPQRQRLEAAIDSFAQSPPVVEAFAGDVVRAEEPIRLPLSGTVLRGSIDLISWTGSDALVVDYKSGAAPGDDAAKRAAHELQAKCYSLAAIADGARSVRTVFVFGEHPGNEVEYRFEAAAADEIRSELERRIEDIRTGRWNHLGAYKGGLCDTCPAFEMICPIRRSRSAG